VSTAVPDDAGRGVALRFSRMPQLRRSLPKLFVQRKPTLVRGGASVPRIEATLEGYELDGGKLADYRKVCGFAEKPYLPVTLPHVLAMPLHMEMLTHAAFPIGLLGLVHVRNTIVQHRRARVDETLTLQAVIEGHREVERGQEFELRTYARVDDELVWEEGCTFLARDRARGRAESKGGERRPSEPLAAAQLTSFAAPAGIGRDYALVSGDFNPIHLTGLSARAFGFPRAIAHGMWTIGRIAAELEPRWPKGRTRYEVQFRQPVLLPGWVVLGTRTAADGAIDFELRDDASERLHLDGRIALED
jgi:acyl dehydratase